MMILFCSPLSATHRASTKKSIAYRADECVTNLKEGITTLRRNVRAVAKQWTLTAAWGTYRTTPELLRLGGDVQATWHGDSAWAQQARIVPADSLVELLHRVRLLREDGSRLLCSRLLFSGLTDVTELTGPLSLVDSTGSYEARADTGWFFEQQHILHLARSCTLLIQASESDPVTVLSDSALIEQPSNRLVASGRVIITGPEIHGTCQDLEYDGSEDRVILTGDPSLQSGQFLCTAQRVVLQRRDGAFSQMVLEGDAWAAQQEVNADSASWDQTWGDRMVLWLRDRKPSSMLVTGNARAIHAVADSSGRHVGINDSHGDSLFLELEDQDLAYLRISGSANGTYVSKHGHTDMPDESTDYSADMISFAKEDHLLTMKGNADLQSGTLRLTASEVRFSLFSKEMVALENAVLRDGEQEVSGKRMSFSTIKRQGVVTNGITQFESAFSFGTQVARVDERSLDIRHGQFTSCDEDHPHFYITSPRMRVTMDDKVVCRPLIMWVHDVPVFWLPYSVFPIRRGRHSGFLVPHFSARNILGLEGSHTSIEDLGYYFVLGDYGDLNLSLDWEEDLGWTAKANARYALRYRIRQGDITFNYARRDNISQWIIHHVHDQYLPHGWRLKADINATRSKEYIDQETPDIEDRLNQQAGFKSALTLNKNLPGWSLRMSLRRDQKWTTTQPEGEEESTTETITTMLPEIVISRPSKRLFSPQAPTVPWFKELYASLSSSFKNQTIQGSDEVTEDHSIGTRHSTSLRWQLPKILRRVSLSPSASYKETWVHLGKEPEQGERMKWDRVGVLSNISVSASTKLYGLLEPPIGPVVALRHVVTPSLGYSYTPDWFTYGWDFRTGKFSQDDDQPYSDAGFGVSSTKSRRLNLGLGNLFQAKLKRGEDVVRKDNLASVNFSTSYDFQRKENGEDPWSSLRTRLDFSPARALSWNLTLNHDPNERLGFLSLTSSAMLRLNGGWERPSMLGSGGMPLEPFRYKWNLTARHSWSHSRGSANDPQTVMLNGSLAPTKGWNVSANLGYDITNNRVMTKGLAITRDLHCWQMNFSWSKSETHWNYRFKIFVKAYPESIFIKHHERQ